MKTAPTAPAHQTDLDWQLWGESDPYYGVITDGRFRLSNLTAEDLGQFFDSGRTHLAHVLRICHRHVQQRFAPRRALDFGCGVGRVLLPMAEQIAEVVGIDVAPGMLEQARRHAKERHLKNVRLVLSDDDLSHLDGDFDLIHSVIVFQHIEPARVRRFTALLLDRLRPGGIAALHYTYAKAYHPDSFGQPPPPPPARRSRWRWRFAAGPAPAATDLPQADPAMQMYAHPINDLLFLAHQAGVRRSYVEFTDHGGELGVVLYFQRPSAA
ncbi:MAG: class I SAM-dependent methyltransferase [Rubrivivax sp.]|jgi:SAM-dependent methyltransferase|nr:class I SAM-dependent methyltransferase [Rubrivivax sp.]